MDRFLEWDSESSLIESATQFKNFLTAPLVLGFSGSLGAGKTTFIRALLRALGENSVVRSPSFSLVETYLLPSMTLHHFDFYRFESAEELEAIGFRDYLSESAVLCIEWPERVSSHHLFLDLEFIIEITTHSRQVRVRSCSEQGEIILSNWIKLL